MKWHLWGIVIGAAILTGCATIGQQAGETSGAPVLAVEWRAADWRFCEQPKCLRPTPKTILRMPVEAPQPVVQPVPAQFVAVKDEPRKVVVLFPFASATPTPQGAAAIKDAARLVRPGDTVILDGRTDSIGGKNVNDALATNRAKYVATQLRRLGVKATIEVHGEGKCCYVAENGTEEGRLSNRRVEIHFSSTPHTKGKE